MPVDCSKIIAAAKQEDVLNIARGLKARFDSNWNEEHVINLIKSGGQSLELPLIRYSDTVLHCEAKTMIDLPLPQTVAAQARPCRTTVGDVLANANFPEVPLKQVMYGAYGVHVLLQEMLGPHFAVMSSGQGEGTLTHANYYTVYDCIVLVKFLLQGTRKPNPYIRAIYPALDTFVGMPTLKPVKNHIFTCSEAIEERRKELWISLNPGKEVKSVPEGYTGRVLAPYGSVAPYYFPATIQDHHDPKLVMVVFEGYEEDDEYEFRREDLVVASDSQAVLEAKVEEAKAAYFQLENAIIAAKHEYRNIHVSAARFQIRERRDIWVEAEKAFRAAFPAATLPRDTWCGGSKINSVLDNIDGVQWAIMNSTECEKLVLNYLRALNSLEKDAAIEQERFKERLDRTFPGLSAVVEALPPYSPDASVWKEPLHQILYGSRIALPGYTYYSYDVYDD